MHSKNSPNFRDEIKKNYRLNLSPSQIIVCLGHWHTVLLNSEEQMKKLYNDVQCFKYSDKQRHLGKFIYIYLRL